MAKTISGKRLMIRCGWVVKSKRSVAEALLRGVGRWGCFRWEVRSNDQTCSVGRWMSRAHEWIYSGTRRVRGTDVLSEGAGRL
jgi:hypothetical protein